MSGRWNKPNVTKEQREEILRVYLEDAEAGTALAVSLGLNQFYAYKLAHERGLLPKTNHIPFEKRRYLVHVYLTEGFTAAKPIAESYGIKPKQISRYARKAGHNGKRGRETGISEQTRKDARWERAIEKGSVVA